MAKSQNIVSIPGKEAREDTVKQASDKGGPSLNNLQYFFNYFTDFYWTVHFYIIFLLLAT